MASIIKANQLQDFGGNSIITSDGAGNVTPNADGIKNVPAFGVYLNANQSLSNSTVTKITFNSEYYDSNSAFDVSSNRFTVPTGKAGKYYFHSTFRYDNGGSYEISNMIYKNGSALIKTRMKCNASVETILASAVLDLAESDYIEIFGLQNQGGSVTVNGDTNGTGSVTAKFFGYKLIGA